MGNVILYIVLITLTIVLGIISFDGYKKHKTIPCLDFKVQMYVSGILALIPFTMLIVNIFF